MKEVWKPIKNYEGLYEISNFGEVRSLPRQKTKGGILKPLEDTRNDYLKVKLCKNGEEKRYTVHRLVAETFIPNPYNKPQVNHKNGNKHDNYFGNLEWCSCQENIVHSYRHQLKKTKKVVQIKDNKIIRIYRSIHFASAETKISYPAIWYCANGRQEYAGGYEWYYLNSPKVNALLKKEKV